MGHGLHNATEFTPSFPKGETDREKRLISTHINDRCDDRDLPPVCTNTAAGDTHNLQTADQCFHATAFDQTVPDKRERTNSIGKQEQHDEKNRMITAACYQVFRWVSWLNDTQTRSTGHLATTGCL